MLMDAPTLGWNVCRIWWAPTTDFVAGPVWANRDEIVSDADVVNHGRFIDESTGSASLVDGFVMSRRPNEYLKRHFGLDDCAFVFTGAVLTDQYLKNRKSKNA